MCWIQVNNLLFFAPSLVPIILTIALACVNSESPKNYFENLMVTPEISFNHISKHNSSNMNGSVQIWTKEHKCESGSFVTQQAWFFNATEGNVVGFFARCAKPHYYGDKVDTNAIGFGTVPFKDLNNPSLVTCRALNTEKKNFAIGFEMRTWTDPEKKWVSIGARQLILEYTKSVSCPGGSDHCRNYTSYCKKGFAICGFQAKILGGNGTLGGGADLKNLIFHLMIIQVKY